MAGGSSTEKTSSILLFLLEETSSGFRGNGDSIVEGSKAGGDDVLGGETTKEGREFVAGAGVDDDGCVKETWSLRVTDALNDVFGLGI